MSLPELWLHQKKAIARATGLGYYGLFFEPGTGKTRTTIELLRGKYNKVSRIMRTIIFCPPIVCQNWRNEWLKYSKIDPEMVTVLDGSGKNRLEKFLTSEAKVFITNYESLRMIELFKAMQVWKPECLVFDESHYLKAHDSQRSKLAFTLANPQDGSVVNRYILSGSPILNTPMDIFQQFKILDGGRTFGLNFFSFRSNYFYDRNAAFKGKRTYFPDWQIQPGKLAEMSVEIARKAMYVKKADCLDLPPFIRQAIPVKMTTYQAKIYNDLLRDYIAFVDGGAVSAPLAITKALRLMQITSGFVSLDAQDDEENVVTTEFEDTEKMKALEELLVDLTPHHKVIVWAVWRHNYKQIRELLQKLKIKYVEVHGEISQGKRDDGVKAFNNDEPVRVLLGHPGSGGVGINLVGASYAIFFSRTFSLEHSLQAEARNYRGGSEIHDKVTRIDLVCQGTIDEEVVSRLHQKEEISAETLKSLAKNHLQR